MNREKFLVSALKTWLKLPFDEIIIVDWSSITPLHSAIFEVSRDVRIKVARVNNKKTYNYAKANNLKVRLSRNNYILAVDGDITLKEDFLIKHQPSDDFFYTGECEIKKGTTGTALFSLEKFKLVNGYSEILEDWGFIDLDLYHRMDKIKYERRIFDLLAIDHIYHDDKMRVQNNIEKNIHASNVRNMWLSQTSPWTLNNKMETQDVTIFYPSNKFENIII